MFGDVLLIMTSTGNLKFRSIFQLGKTSSTFPDFPGLKGIIFPQHNSTHLFVFPTTTTWSLSHLFSCFVSSIHYTSVGRGELCSRIRRLTLTGALSVSSLDALPPAGRFAETNNNPLRSNSDSTYYLSNT